MQMAPSPPPVSPVRGKRRTGGLRLAFRRGGMSVAKLTVGLLTGGLGILSKAIHSSLGLASSTMTFFRCPRLRHPGRRETIQQLRITPQSDQNRAGVYALASASVENASKIPCQGIKFGNSVFNLLKMLLSDLDCGMAWLFLIKFEGQKTFNRFRG